MGQFVLPSCTCKMIDCCLVNMWKVTMRLWLILSYKPGFDPGRCREGPQQVNITYSPLTTIGIKRRFNCYIYSLWSSKGLLSQSNECLGWAIPGLFCCSLFHTTCKKLLSTKVLIPGFELMTSGVTSNHSAKCTSPSGWPEGLTDERPMSKKVAQKVQNYTTIFCKKM